MKSVLKKLDPFEELVHRIKKPNFNIDIQNEQYDCHGRETLVKD